MDSELEYPAGGGPSVSASDTLVGRTVAVLASWLEAAARAAGRPWRSGPRWIGSWLVEQAPLSNAVTLRQPMLDAPEILAEIDALIPPHEPYLLISAWPTPDLRRYGFGLLGHPPFMARPPGPRPDGRADAVHVREVRDAEDLAVAERVLVDGFPLPGLEKMSRGGLLAPELLDCRTRAWVAWHDGEPVAMSLAHYGAGVQLVEYVATLPSARRLGAGSAVTWAATLAEPDLPAVLVASDDGRPIYERMGYLPIERWTVWSRPIASTHE